MFKKIIFNPQGIWLWLEPDDLDFIGHRMLESGGFDVWKQAEVYVPDDPDYDVEIHDKQVETLIANREGEAFTLTPQQQEKATELHFDLADAHACKGSGVRCYCNDTSHEHCIECDAMCSYNTSYEP